MNDFIIGIDASNIRSGGGLVHLKELINSFDIDKFAIQKIVIWSCKNTLNEIDDNTWLKKCYDPFLEHNYFVRFLWQYTKLNKQISKESCDMLFVPGGSNFTKFNPIVTMSQNLLPFELKELFRYGFSYLTLKFCLLRLSQSISFKNANGVIFLTDYAKNSVKKVVNQFKGSNVVIPHGISKKFFLRPRPQIEINNYAFDNPFQLLYVSPVEPYKHHFQVIDAVVKLRCEEMPIELRLIGSANISMLKKLRKKMYDADPKKKFIHYYGFTPHENLPLLYSSANIFIFASSCENMPITMMEGMASGVPIACSNLGPMPKILSDGGVYFDPENSDSIAFAIRKLIKSPKLREKISQSAFQKAHQYSWTNCANETFKFFLHVVNDYNRNKAT